MKPLLFSLLFLTASTVGVAQTLGIPLGRFATVDRTDDFIVLNDDRVLAEHQGRVYEYSADGDSLGLFTFNLSRPLTQLVDGRILFNAGNDEIVAVQPDGLSREPFGTAPGGPIDAVQLADGRVLVATIGDPFSNPSVPSDVYAFAPDGTPLGIFAADLDNPQAIEQLRDGRILVAEYFGTVLAFAPDGTPLDPFIDRITPGFDMLQLPDGRILLACFTDSPLGQESDEVQVYSPEGEWLGPLTTGLSSAPSVGRLSDGRVLVLEFRVGTARDTLHAYGVVPVASEPVPEAGEAVTAVYPSPVRAGHPARLGLALGAPAEVTVTVHDTTGREISRETHALSAGEQSVEVKTARLAAGVYAVRAVGPDVGATRRLVVVR